VFVLFERDTRPPFQQPRSIRRQAPFAPQVIQTSPSHPQRIINGLVVYTLQVFQINLLIRKEISLFGSALYEYMFGFGIYFFG